MVIIIPHGFEPNYTLGFVKGLLANGIEFCVISSDTDEGRLSERGIHNINLRGSQDPNRPIFKKALNILKYYACLLMFLVRNRWGVVHFTGLFGNSSILFDWIILNTFFKLFSSRYIYTAHNVLPHSKRKSRLFKWIYRQIYRVPDVLLVHTESAKRRLLDDFSLSEGKLRVISIGMNEEMAITGLTKGEARSQLGFEAGDRVVLFFGKVEAYKGLDTLIRAFNELSTISVKLLISGWFPDPVYRGKVLSAIEGSFRRQDIHLHEGFLPNEKVEVFFKSADVLALPYRNIYQSGLVFLCYHFGLPIVATDVGSLREFIGRDMGVIAERNDPEGLADALVRFFDVQDRFKPEEIMEKGKKFKWDSICKPLVPLYQ